MLFTLYGLPLCLHFCISYNKLWFIFRLFTRFFYVSNSVSFFFFYKIYLMDFQIQKLYIAKEAVSKALGTGVRGFSLSDVEILNDELGKPTVTLYNNLLNHAEDLKIQISISHSREYAVSTVIIYKE